MDTGKNKHIPTNARVQGHYNGTLVKGYTKQMGGKVYMSLDGGGSVDLKAITEIKVLCEIEDVSVTEGVGGIVTLTNGIMAPWGLGYQHKTRRGAEAISDAICQLCEGIEVSMKETGKAMQQPIDEEIQAELSAYADYVYKLKNTPFEVAKDIWGKLTDKERLSLPMCHSCGSLDTSCQCWNDE